MKRNGLVLVPREPPKRVILYPTQDLTSQQQPTNGVSARVKTALVNNNQHYQRETVQQSTNELRLSRQQTASSLPNGISKLAGKSEHERVVSQPAGQPTSQNAGQRGQNPYYGNPFFRPKPATNQLSTTTPVFNGNLPQTPPSRDSSTVVTGLSTQTHTSVSTTATVVNRGRPPVVLKTTNPNVPSNGRMQEPEITTDALPSQEDNRRWAHTVASAPAVRRVVNGEGPNIPFKSSETNISSHANNDAFKQKATSATDIVISLMDTWRAPINPGSSSITNMFTRNGITRDDSTVASQTLPAGEQVTSAPPFITVGTSAAGSHSNQNWKKALVANFQKNSRNNPTAKLFTSKQTNVPIQPPTVVNNDTTTANQQSKPERTMMLNGLNSERTFQLSENPPSIPSLIRKTTESFRLTKQDNNTNNIERSASLQIQSTMYSNTASIVVENKPEKSVQPIEVPIPENIPLIPIPIPSTLITAKPQANVEQQRAIITRVMIRRDFVKSTESKPAIPAVAMNFRSSIAPQSAKPGGLPTDNATAVTTIIEHVNVVNSNVNGNRIYPFQPPQSQQQSVPLSQKSLLAYTSTNPTTRESYKTELNAHQTNGFTNDVLTSSSMMKIQQSQIMTTNGPNIRSNSLSATNAESKRKKDELTNKLKKRAISASAASNDG